MMAKETDKKNNAEKSTREELREIIVQKDEEIANKQMEIHALQRKLCRKDAEQEAKQNSTNANIKKLEGTIELLQKHLKSQLTDPTDLWKGEFNDVNYLLSDISK